MTIVHLMEAGLVAKESVYESHRRAAGSAQGKLNMRRIIDWDPSKGMAFQGDVSLIPVPIIGKLDLANEIDPVGGRLILQEGEITGHHHAIALSGPSSPENISLEVERLISSALTNKNVLPTARLYRDPATVAKMQQHGILSRSDLVVALLIVEGGAMVLSHEEHDGIRIPPGAYLVGRQIESAGAEERRVCD